MYTRIVVPLDGSDIAEQALATAEELVRLTGASLHLVRVVEFPSSSYTYAYGSMLEGDAIVTQLEDQIRLAEAYLAEVARPIAAAGMHDLVCFGHSHRRSIEQVGRTVLLNPGEVMVRFGVHSVGVYDTSTGQAEILEF